MGKECPDCGAEKTPIDPPEGAVELRDAISRLILDSGLVRVANFNLIFNNGCEDVNVTPGCDCDDTSGRCFAATLRAFTDLIADVATTVEEDGAFSTYDGDGGEKKVEPLKH